MLTLGQIVDAQKAQLTALHEMSSKALSAAEKMAGLHMEATKASWAQQSHHVQALWSAKTPQELASLQSSALQSLTEKTSAYGRDLYGIQQGPQGSNAVLSVFKDAVSAATDAVESVRKVVKQTTDLAQANLAVATEKTASN